MPRTAGRSPSKATRSEQDGKLALMSAPDRPGRRSAANPQAPPGGSPRVISSAGSSCVPALAFYAMFVLQPLVLSLQYSFYDWNGVGAATWVGLDNYPTVFSDEELLNAIFNAFKLIFFFSVIPVSVGLVTASVIRRAASGGFGTVSRTVLFLPQIIPLVAAGIMWNWVLSKSGTVNQILTAVGLGGITGRGSATSTGRCRRSG